MDTCSEAAAELEKEGFEKEIFQQLRESSPDHKYDLVSQCLSSCQSCMCTYLKQEFKRFTLLKEQKAITASEEVLRESQ